MPSTATQNKLVALPVQVIDISNGVILKRGSIEVMITGAHAGDTVRRVLTLASGEGATQRQIRQSFPKSVAKQIDSLIKNLTDRRLLVPTDGRSDSKDKTESPLDIFSWHFGESTRSVGDRFNKVRLAIVGVNSISRQLVMGLMRCGYKNFTVIDHPRHRQEQFFYESGTVKSDEWPFTLAEPQPWKESLTNDLGDGLVATSDFGGQGALCHWNTVCLSLKLPFLPVVLKNMIGYVGPLVIPGRTACYECLHVRQRSHMMDPYGESVADGVAFEGQRVVGFHPSMAAILGDIATFELTKFFGALASEALANTLIEVNLLARTMIPRRVLKVPRCPACSPLHTSSETNLNKVLFPDDTGLPLQPWLSDGDVSTR